MAEPPTETTPAKSRKSDEKSRRLAAALRQNLARRKAQIRARQDAGPETDPDGAQAAGSSTPSEE